MQPRAVIVIGASAGGIEALRAFVSALDAGVPAAVFVVVHVPPHGTSVLPAILERAGSLPAQHATDGDVIRSGRIYVAPPDVHLLLERDRMYLRRGPHENGSRPAVDPLFRTAAHAFGTRVIGVVLSGSLDDGTAGLATIKRHGGMALVQNPEEALHPGMPRSALEVVEADFVLSAGDLGRRANGLARRDVEERAVPSGVRRPDPQGEVDMADPNGPEGEGAPAGISCPQCNGSLWELEEEGQVRFRCRIGHRFGPESLLAAQDDALETALWTAVRSLEESAATARRLAARLAATTRPGRVARYLRRAQEAEEHAGVIRQLLQGSNAGVVVD